MTEKSEKHKPVLIAMNKHYLQIKKLTAMIQEVKPLQQIIVGEEAEVLQLLAKEMISIANK